MNKFLFERRRCALKAIAKIMCVMFRKHFSIRQSNILSHEINTIKKSNTANSTTEIQIEVEWKTIPDHL